MSAEVTDRPALLDTNILIHWAQLDPRFLPERAAISAVTVAELAAGVHAATSDVERARRLDILQRAESGFDPLPFDIEAARSYGRVVAAVKAAGRSPRGRVADQMIAAIAAAHGLPVYTTNADDFAGLEDVVSVVAVPRPTGF